MKIDRGKRKALAKVFINITGIVFGLLLIGPLVSEKGFNLLIFVFGTILFFVFLYLAIIFEPPNDIITEELTI